MSIYLSNLTLSDIKLIVIHFDIYLCCYLGEEEGSGGGMDMEDRNGNIGRATTFNPWQREYFFFCRMTIFVLNFVPLDPI